MNFKVDIVFAGVYSRKTKSVCKVYAGFFWFNFEWPEFSQFKYQPVIYRAYFRRLVFKMVEFIEFHEGALRHEIY